MLRPLTSILLALGWCIGTTTTSLSPPPSRFQHDQAGRLGVPVVLTTTSFSSSPPLPSPTFTVLFTANFNETRSEKKQILGCQDVMKQIFPATDTSLAVMARCGSITPSSGNKEIFTGFTDLGGSTRQPLFIGEGYGTWGKKNKFMGIYTSTGDELRQIIDRTDHLPMFDICVS